MTLDGNTLEEKAEYLTTWNKGRLNALITALQKAVFDVKSSLDAEGSFRGVQSVSESDDDDLREDEME